MADEDSSSTSCENKSEFSENPTRDALADGLMSFIKPKVDNLYKLVDTVKENQKNLKTELDAACTDLDDIFAGDDGLSANFQKYANKISEMKHQITVIDNVLQSAHNRLEDFTSKMQNLQKSRKTHFQEFTTMKNSPDQK